MCPLPVDLNFNKKQAGCWDLTLFHQKQKNLWKCQRTPALRVEGYANWGFQCIHWGFWLIVMKKSYELIQPKQLLTQPLLPTLRRTEGVLHHPRDPRVSSARISSGSPVKVERNAKSWMATAWALNDGGQWEDEEEAQMRNSSCSLTSVSWCAASLVVLLPQESSSVGGNWV